MEKKKRSRRKRLNLIGEDDSGLQFYSPSQVHQAKAFANEKEVKEQMERNRIDACKATALANRLRKKEEQAARAIQASIRKQEALEKRLQKAAEIQARKDLRQAAKRAPIAVKAQRCTTKSTTKLGKDVVASCQSVVVASKSGVIAEPKVVTSRGRAVKRSAKLRT